MTRLAAGPGANYRRSRRQQGCAADVPRRDLRAFQAATPSMPGWRRQIARHIATPSLPFPDIPPQTRRADDAYSYAGRA